MRLYDFSKFRMYFADTRESVCILQNWKGRVDKYLLEISLMSLKGYSSTDISEIMRENYLK